MSMQTDYREQVDRICEQAALPDGKELLEMAKNYAEIDGTTWKPRSRIRMIRTGVIIAAACAAAAGVTAIGAGAAGYGPLSVLFREKYQDSTTADLIDEGYLCEINESFRDGIYRANLIGVSGDLENPMLIIDLYIDNPDIAAANETVKIGVYTLGVYQYENELDQYAWSDGTAYRDSEIPNLYHASIRGAPYWMSNGEECVIDITAIDRNEPNGTSVIDRTHMETRLTIPTEALADTDLLCYSEEENMVLSYNGIDYMLTEAQFSSYQTEICFHLNMNEFFAVSPEEAGTDADVFKDGALNDALILTVDGTAFRCEPDCCYIWWDRKDECNNGEIGYVTAVFDVIDFQSAETIILSAGDASLTLKDSSFSDDSGDRTESSDPDADTGAAESSVSTAEPADSTAEQTDDSAPDVMTYAFHNMLNYTDEDHAILRFGDIDYHLNYVQFNKTETEIGFFFDAESYDDAALNDALSLTIDGETYSCKPYSCYTWYDTEGEAGVVNRGYVHPIFPVFNYNAARTVVLSVGDASYTLK